MKNYFLRAIAIALFLLVIPAMSRAQEKGQLRDYENGFLFNVFDIANVEERVQLASALATSDIWICNPTDNPGELFIRPNSYNEDIPIYAEFDYLRMLLKKEYQEVSSLPKEQFSEIFNSWAQNISVDFYNFLISDLVGERANHCMNAEPFCTTDVYNFPALNSGVSWTGPNYGCLGSSPTTKHSFWYYMRVGVAGNITIKIQASFDVDFALWGPFSNEIDPCPTSAGQTGLLTATCSYCPNNTSSSSNYPYGNLHDCSYDAAHFEYAHVVNGQVGQYYILLITNFSGSSGNITFQKYAGNGETDCGIMPPLVNNDGPFCVGDVIHLTANGQSGASYHWTGPNGYSSNQQNPTINNCNTTHTGSYTCTITVGNQSNNASTEITVYPKPTANFTATSVCLGNSTEFTSTSTTNPANQAMTYLWDFGGGQTSNLQNPTFQFSTAGTHQVSLTVSCGNGTCTSTKTQSVTVYPNPVANAGEDQTVIYGATATLSGSGGSGTFNYHWEPADKVVNPNAQTTQTVALQQSTTFTLTATHPQGGCSSTDQVSVLVQGSNMTATASASPTSICLDQTSQLRASGIGGTGNYTYSWTPTIGLSAPNIANPVAHPTETTTYSCLVSDGMSSQTVTTTVTVNYPEYEEVEQYICPGESYTFYGYEYSEEGNYDYHTTTAQGCEKVITLHLHQYPDYPNAHTTTEYICPGTSIQFYGQYYSTPGRYPKAFETIHGCDSIVWLDLNVYTANDTIPVDGYTCIGKPFLYHGMEYTENTDMYFDTIDENGCLLVEHFRLTVGEYQTDPDYEPNVFWCYDFGEEPEYAWVIKGDTIKTYHENAIDSITIPDPSGECDFKYMLNLKFHSRFYNEIDTTVCNVFEWEVDHNTYYSSQRLYKNIALAGGSQFKCDSIYIVNLTVNYDKDTTFNVSSCNRYVWEFSNDGTDTIIEDPGTYTKKIMTHQGCDSIGTLNLQLDYSPSFDLVEGHSWVVGGSEFQFTVEDYWINTQGSHLTSWELRDKNEEPFTRWDILPYGDNFDRCLVYIYTYELDTIYIHATTKSTGQGNELCGDQPYTMSKMIICSSYGTPEITQHCSVDIYPNPNDGNMTLSFTNMPGDILVKVFNIQGAQIDQFQVHNGYESSTHPYNSNRLAPGVYFFSITSHEGSLNKKVIITQ